MEAYLGEARGWAISTYRGKPGGGSQEENGEMKRE